MLERDIERYVNRKAKETGCLTYKFTSPGNPGVPDRIIITPKGQTIFVELKAKCGRLANIQKYQIARMRDLGCDVRVITGMDEAKQLIEDIRKEVVS